MIPHSRSAMSRRPPRRVAAIQSRGVSHGNLKTSNLLVSAESDSVRVLGWGMAIANLLPEEESRAAPTRLLPQPGAGRRDLVLPQSDVYALGVIVYELVTGVVPFEGPLSRRGGSQKRLLDVTPPTPPSGRRPGVPGPVDKVVHRALERTQPPATLRTRR